MNRQSDFDSWDPDYGVQYQPPTRQQYSKTFNKKPGKNADDLLIEIEARLAGIIIGKGGVKIKSLKQESGAFISVIDSDNCEQKTVKISGNARAKNLAKKLINDIIKEKKTVKIPEVVQAEGSVLYECAVENYNWDEFQKEQEENRKKTIAALAPIVKNVYNEDPEVSMMTDQEAKDFRSSKNNMLVKYLGGNMAKPIPKPVWKFSHAFQDFPEILEKLKKQKFETPSPLQCQTWPIIMSGHDLITIVQTRTGKILAFLLPALIHIGFQLTPRSEKKGPSVLVLAPTKELVLQIESEVIKYSYKGIKSMSIYDGNNSDKQRVLRYREEIVIATPCRLKTLICTGAIDLTDVTFLIFYEVDRMLDMGFESQIRGSMLTMRPDRQTIMTSATWPVKVQRLVKSYTSNPIQVIVVGPSDLTAINTVKQDILIMEEGEKVHWLEDFLKDLSEDDKTIIFVKRKITVDHLSEDLWLKGYTVESIHGEGEQSIREMALERLHSGEVSILITTDVASRGIDINDITVVINYDFTSDIEEYVHRVGQTGRAGKTGLVISLVTRRDWGKAKELVEVMEKSGQVVPSGLKDIAKWFDANQAQERAEESERPFGDRRGGGERGFSGGNVGFGRKYW